MHDTKPRLSPAAASSTAQRSGVVNVTSAGLIWRLGDCQFGATMASAISRDLDKSRTSQSEPRRRDLVGEVGGAALTFSDVTPGTNAGDPRIRRAVVLAAKNTNYLVKSIFELVELRGFESLTFSVRRHGGWMGSRWRSN
jgi:hypothetical protein